MTPFLSPTASILASLDKHKLRIPPLPFLECIRPWLTVLIEILCFSSWRAKINERWCTIFNQVIETWGLDETDHHSLTTAFFPLEISLKTIESSLTYLSQDPHQDQNFKNLHSYCPASSITSQWHHLNKNKNNFPTSHRVLVVSSQNNAICRFRIVE